MIEIINSGAITSIQDMGRWGYQHIGFSVSGAMDKKSYKLSNLLVNNCESAATLEFIGLGPVIKFNKKCLIAITGGNFNPLIKSSPVPMYRPVLVLKNSVIKFFSPVIGFIGYISFYGGLDIPNFLSSKSTSINFGFGGLNGRKLKKGDKLAIKKIQKTFYLTKKSNNEMNYASWYVNEKIKKKKVNVIRFLPGIHWDLLNESDKDTFLKSSFVITSKSNRMAYKLKGKKINIFNNASFESEVTNFGSIQVPPDGDPMILLSERQVTGGFARLGEIISSDHDFFVQLSPGSKINFVMVSLDCAEKLALSSELNFKYISHSLKVKEKYDFY